MKVIKECASLKIENQILTKKIFIMKYIYLIVFLFVNTPAICQENLDFDKGQLLDEVSETVIENIYDATFDSIIWKQQVDNCRQKLPSIKTLDQFDGMVNELLSTLKTSHTYFFSRNNPKRYQLLGVFEGFFGNSDTTLYYYEGIGIHTKTIGDKDIIISVYDGFPGDQSGLKYGDQIVSVDGKNYHPTKSFEGKSNQQVKIKIIRQDQTLTLMVPVKMLDGRTMFVDALKSSIRIVKRKNKKIGYLHMWSYAGSKYQEELRSTLLWGALSECDALVLDLRDGWGGADVNSLNLFREPIAVVKSTPKDGDPIAYSGVWGNPVALLINERSGSGKELFTYGFKKLGLGTVVGNQSAGAVVAGSPFVMSSGDVLYIAVRDVKVDNIRLEGVGVQPDIIIERPFDSKIDDPQLEKALEELSVKIEDEK